LLFLLVLAGKSVRFAIARHDPLEPARIGGPALEVAEALHAGEQSVVCGSADDTEDFGQLIAVVVEVRRFRTLQKLWKSGISMSCTCVCLRQMLELLKTELDDE
jgi:hypothetical protein